MNRIVIAIFGAATTGCVVAAYFDVANRGACGFAAVVFGAIRRST